VPNDAFRQIIASIDYPMIVVTAARAGERTGCLVGFHTQCSIDPPRWLVCISKANHTHRIAQQTGRLVVHVLRDDQRDLAELFGETTGDEVDKFTRCRWHDDPEGVPVLDGCDWFAGSIAQRLDLGDHTGHLLDVTDAGVADLHAPRLGFQQVRTLDPGHPA
jgi:flavin reductase (DIM6/NTAB) family NADH-FMN oxidoreductase RutF